MTTNYQPLKIDQVLDSTQFTLDGAGLDNLIAKLEAIAAPAHTADGHKFEDDPDKNGVCKHCGWVHPEVPADCCHKPVKEHLTRLLTQVKSLRDGTSLGIEVIEITVVAAPRRKRRRGWLFN